MPNTNNCNQVHLELFSSAEILRNGRQLQIVKKANVSQYEKSITEQVFLYKDFLLSSFPYLYINAPKFALAVSEQLPDWPLTDCLELFR